LPLFVYIIIIFLSQIIQSISNTLTSSCYQIGINRTYENYQTVFVVCFMEAQRLGGAEAADTMRGHVAAGGAAVFVIKRRK
jgi:hypothetical protein